MDLALTDSIAIPEDVVFRELDEEAVLLNLKTGIYFGLNPVGTRIWQLISEQRSLARVLDEMQREYSIDRQILEKDLLDLATELCANGLGEVIPA